VPLDLTLDRTDPAPYDIVVGDMYAVLPFGNSVVARSVTGAQTWAAIQNGVSRTNWNGTRCVGADGRFPQISGFKFTFTCAAAANSGLVTGLTLLDGTPIPNDGSTSYTFATSNFVTTGGDGYTMFVDGQGVTRDFDAKALLDYVDALDSITPTLDGRSTGTLAP
jgi:5'-nucleotidase